MKGKEYRSIDPAEVEQFSRIADEWWDANGKFKPLHQINPVRIGYLKETLAAHFERDARAADALSGLSLVDIGCGGGLISEPMARLGAAVTGLDASERNIKTAALHAEQSGLESDYVCSSAEALAEEKGAHYDVVLALEILEHVADVEVFLEACAALVRPGGMLIVSTMNRTLKSYALAIVGAEYVLRWLPKGTHDWHKFLKPSEIEAPLRRAGLALQDVQGMTYQPLTASWKMTPKDVSVNYLMAFTKR